MTSRDLWVFGLGAVCPPLVAIALGVLADTPLRAWVVDRVTPV